MSDGSTVISEIASDTRLLEVLNEAIGSIYFLEVLNAWHISISVKRFRPLLTLTGLFALLSAINPTIA